MELDLRQRATATLGAAVLLMTASACGGADRADGGAGPGGSGAATVRGEIEGEFEGYATYTDASLELGHFSVTITDNRRFGIELTMPVEDGGPPAEGSYDIAEALGSGSFRASFREFRGGSFMDAAEYSAVEGEEGGVKITTSSDEAVSASFAFDAVNREDGSAIRVEGGFQAVQVRGGMQ